TPERNELSLRHCCLDPLRVKAPELAAIEVGQPNRAEAETHRVAAFAGELLNGAVGRDIDASQRSAEHGDPNRAAAERDVAALPGLAGLNRLRHFVSLHVDLRYGAIALV